jgi:hypothetical protein
MTEVKLFDTPEYTFKQSVHNHLPPVPIRGALVGGSGSGKSRCLVSLILHQYRRCFDRIFVFSPRVDIDMTWQPVKRYVSDVLKVDTNKEPAFFAEWDPAQLEKIIDDQYRIIEFQKKQKHKKLLSILVVIDDHADNAQLVHNNNGILAKLYFRGRHLGISTLVSTQKLKAISSAIRANLQFLFVWRLRNYSELESLLEELSAIHDKKTLMAMYNKAVNQPYNFWNVILVNRPDDMFWDGMKRRQVVKDNASETADSGGRGGSGQHDQLHLSTSAVRRP